MLLLDKQFMKQMKMNMYAHLYYFESIAFQKLQMHMLLSFYHLNHIFFASLVTILLQSITISENGLSMPTGAK